MAAGEKPIFPRERQRPRIARIGLFAKAISGIEKDNNITKDSSIKEFKESSLKAAVGKSSGFQDDVSSLSIGKCETVGLKPELYPVVNSKNSKVLRSKSHEKYNYDSGKHHSNLEKKESNFKSTNQNYAEGNEQIKLPSRHRKSVTNKSEDEESENFIQFKEIKHCREILNPEEKNFKIVLKNDECVSIPVSSSTKILTTSNSIFDSQRDLSCSVFDPKQIFAASEEENYIPPPVDFKALDTGTYQDFSNTASERNDVHALQNGNLEAVSDLADSEDESCFSLPDSEQIDAVTNFLLTVVKDKSVSSVSANRVVRDLNSVFRDQLDGQSVNLYGSYSSDLAISTSDINLALVSDCSIRKSFMFQVHKVISKEFSDYYVYPYEEGSSAYESKINFSHPDTGVKCELAYLGKYKENICKMGTFLRRISVCDTRIKTLILAAKIWSECLCINEVEDGKLHPVGYALMVVHFLQHCDDPILPNFPCELGEKELLAPNNLSVGELWLAFLKFYAVTFNWKKNVISVKSDVYISKKSKDWENYWIAVEDPYTEKNIAVSVVNSDVADYIKACFKSSYDYFCNPPDDIVIDSSTEDDESNGSAQNSKWQFSFQQCIAEQSDTFCENCDEIMDTCDDCQKKMYVQPMSPLPKMTDSFLEMVKESLNIVYEKYMLTDEEITDRRQFVKKLEARMRSTYRDAELFLFGSSANGFGFKNSDLDICITFKSKKVINSVSILKDVRFLLRKDKNFDHVIAIFGAQIPIVKFHYQPKGWRGDISLHNTLAIHNSSLLHTYSMLDERCKILGCALKLLAKKALVAEVTEKALSSYSYLNMVIYFLQQIEPPVLPVLQDNKFRNNNYDISSIVENYNVWFCKDLDYIKTVFKAENKTPVEQLWLELLDFYCTFNSDKFISIRQKEPVIRKNKHSARLFNIQDPFIESKNLGCVVSAKKAEETINVLRRARQLFRTPRKELPTCVKDIEDLFFSTQSLTGRIHKEVHCDLCGKFGHERKECKSNFSFPKYNFRRNWKNPNQRYINRTPNKNHVSKAIGLSKTAYQKI